MAPFANKWRAHVQALGLFQVASGLRGCGHVPLLGLFLSTPHEGEVLEIVEIVRIMPLRTFVS